MKNNRKLVRTENKAYSMILLVEGDRVIGAWDYQELGIKENFENPGDLRDWEAHYPDETKVSDYGTPVEEKTNIESYTLTATSPINGVDGRGWVMTFEHGDGKWSSEQKGDSQFYDILAEAKADMERQAEKFEEFVTLSVGGGIYDSDGELVESVHFELKGTKDSGESV